MIITRTPFRISFFGGGTDFPAFYREHGGAVLSTTINKYCYIMTRELPPFFDYKYRIRYTTREETKSIEDIRHPVVRAILEEMNLPCGIEMVHTSDIPAMSGIGSSSAFTVGFLQGIHALAGKMTTKRQLANGAIDIEQNQLHENVGSQDQIAVAFGGLNHIEFRKDGSYFVNPITIPFERLRQLEKSCMLFFTGFTRYSSQIQSEQIKNIHHNTDALIEMTHLVEEAVTLLNSNRQISEFGNLLDYAWRLKRSLSRMVSNEMIDDCYETAKKAGALGGKILGAGGGGFLLVFAEPERQQAVREALEKLLLVPFRFENVGTQITMYSTIDYSNN